MKNFLPIIVILALIVPLIGCDPGAGGSSSVTPEQIDQVLRQGNWNHGEVGWTGDYMGMERTNRVSFPYDIKFSQTFSAFIVLNKGSATYTFRVNENLELDDNYGRKNEHYAVFDSRAVEVIKREISAAKSKLKL